MAKKLTSVLGLDIGSQKIKIAEVRLQGREPVISAIGMVDTPEGAVDHTGVYNPDAVGAAVKQAIADAGASVPQVVVSIAGQASVLVRTLPVPRMNPTELKEHMQWEINRNIPFAESDVQADFKALPDDDPNSANIDVVMAIAPRSAIDTMIACVKKSGKNAAAIDVEPLGLARSLTQSYDDVLQNQTVCLVDMGHKSTAINIYRNGKLLQPRQIPIGGEMFTKAISDGLNVSNDEAEKLKREQGEIPEEAVVAGSSDPFASGGATQQFTPYNPFSDDPAPAAGGTGYDPMAGAPEPSTAMVTSSAGATTVFNAMAPVLDEFLAEVRRSIDYFRSRDGEIDRIVLCGGGTKLRGLAEFLSKSLAISTENYDPLRRIQVNARKVEPGFLDAHRQEFAVAVGNGLHILFD
jgi:type IV pilus assembly protein PilM